MSELNCISRHIAIGDIHGNIKALTLIIDAINPRPTDTLYFLGDYIDRGDDSYSVVEFLINLQSHPPCKIIMLMGNHEQMLINSHKNSDDKPYWKSMWAKNGCKETLDSYKRRGLSKIPDYHLSFFNELLPYYETEWAIFCHATPCEYADMPHQKEDGFFWRRPSEANMLNGYRHVSGKPVICGHTSQRNYPVKTAQLLLIDTGCGKYLRGVLSAVELQTMLCYSVKNDKNVEITKLPFDEINVDQVLKNNTIENVDYSVIS